MCAHLVLLPVVILALALLLTAAASPVNIDLSSETWRLTNSRQTVAVPTKLPAHVLGVLAAAGVVPTDPLYRYGELETRWVSDDTWNFTLIWSGQKHQEVQKCKHVLLVLHGVDTFGDVVLNGQHVLRTNNAHRSWWLTVPSDALHDSANMLSIILQPAVQTALRAKLLNKYTIPTMAVPGAFDVYNFARKPASDFGWDWGPAFAPAGVTGPVQLMGFDRATLIGALIHQQANSSSSSSISTFLLHVTAQLLVPEGGDSGLLTVQLPDLGVEQHQQVSLTAVTVAGNPLQALTHMTLEISADQVELWQPRGLLQPGSKSVMYNVIVSFQPSSSSAAAATVVDGDGAAGIAAGVDQEHSGVSSSIIRRIGFRTVDLVRVPIKAAAAELVAEDPGSSSSSSTDPAAAAAVQVSSMPADLGTWAQIQGIWRQVTNNVTDRPVWWYPQSPPGRDWPASTSTQPEIIRAAVQAKPNKLHNRATVASNNDITDQVTVAQDQQQEKGQERQHLTAAAAVAAAAAGSSQTEQQQQDEVQEEDGESFYFRVNGVPIYAKGANLIPLHVLSTATTADDVVLLLQSAAAANMNMIRIWGGGLYQLDALYGAADDLGLLIWQEAMFACSPYPRDASFLSNVDAELTKQILRLGSHPSIILWGGNNEIEASLDWYNETNSNLALYAVDYDALFEKTIGKVVQQMLPGIPWVDSSPSNGHITLDNNDSVEHHTEFAAADSTTTAAAAVNPSAVIRPISIKRWGNSQHPRYGDVHYYNYKDDCQDWRTYPAARFISEYGWQSYPSWATYRAATDQQDWTLAAAMTEYRQRHPNGTIELLAQLTRRFRLPQSWQETLDKHKQQQQQQQIRPQQSRSSTLDITHQVYTKIVDALLHVWRSVRQCVNPPAGQRPTDSTSSAASSSSSSSSSSTSPSTPRSQATRSDHDHARIYNEIQHWIYLTQLQQMLCYDTALSYWRRLRSQADVLTMGVLYWQLNDIWAGASWSSIDYGGVWKPLHYQLAKSFADLSLSVQHDLHNDTLQIHVVSDLPFPIKAKLRVRLLSLSDTSESCPSIDSSSGGSSSYHGDVLGDNNNWADGRTLQYSRQEQQQQLISEQSAAAAAAACKDTWSRSCQIVSLHVPARSSVQGFSSPIAVLLAAASGCSSSSCYVHITLQAADQTTQETTVWLAPFDEINLVDPKLQVAGFELSGTTGNTNQFPTQTAAAAAAGNEPEITFTINSWAVAVYTVLELEGNSALPGHFSDNAITIHPCEQRKIKFVPHLGTGNWQDYLVASGQQQQQGSLHQQGGKSRLSSEGGSSSTSASSSSSLEGNGIFIEFLQQQLVVSSLYDHQQFSPTAG